MGAALTCPDYIRLRDDYEESLRKWAKVMRLPDAAFGEAKLTAFDRRNDALSRMTTHREFCPTCLRDKWKLRAVKSGDR